MIIPLYIVSDKSDLIDIDDRWNVSKLKSVLSNRYNVNQDQIVLHYRGKPVSGGELTDFNFKPYGNLFMKAGLVGGKTAAWVRGLFIFLLIFLFIFFFVMMITVFIPMFSHFFGCYLVEGIKTLITYLSGKPFEGKSLIFKVIIFIIRYFVVFIFVYSICAIMFAMFIFNLKQNFCNSMILGKYIGFTLTVIFIVFYGLFVLPDTVAQLAREGQQEIPAILGFLFTPILSLSQWLSDEGKFSLIYLIPGFGQLLLMEHEILPFIVDGLYLGLSNASQIGCDKNDFAEMITGLLYFTDTPDGQVMVEDYNLYQAVKLTAYAFEKEIKQIVGGGGLEGTIERQVLKKLKESGVKLNIKKLNEIRPKNKVSGSKTDTKDVYGSTGCKKNIFKTILKAMKLKWKYYDEASQTWSDKNAEKEYNENPCKIGWVTAHALPAARQLICAFLAFIPELYRLLNNCVGAPFVLTNMIKNSQIAGIFTSIAAIIIIILAVFGVKMFGYHP